MPFLLVPMELFDVLKFLGGGYCSLHPYLRRTPGRHASLPTPGTTMGGRTTDPPRVRGHAHPHRTLSLPAFAVPSPLARRAAVGDVADLYRFPTPLLEQSPWWLRGRPSPSGAFWRLRRRGLARLVGGGDALLRHGRLCYGSQPTSFRHTLRGSVRHGTLDCSSQATALLVVTCWEGERRAHFPGQFIGRLCTPPCLCYDDTARFGAFQVLLRPW